MRNIWAVAGVAFPFLMAAFIAGDWHGTRDGRCATLREVTEELAVTPPPARDRATMVELSTWYQAKAKGEGCW